MLSLSLLAPMFIHRLYTASQTRWNESTDAAADTDARALRTLLYVDARTGYRDDILYICSWTSRAQVEKQTATCTCTPIDTMIIPSCFPT